MTSFVLEDVIIEPRKYRYRNRPTLDNNSESIDSSSFPLKITTQHHPTNQTQPHISHTMTLDFSPNSHFSPGNDHTLASSKPQARSFHRIACPLYAYLFRHFSRTRERKVCVYGSGLVDDGCVGGVGGGEVELGGGVVGGWMDGVVAESGW